MTEVTKACNLTESEIKTLIGNHGFNFNDRNRDEKIERINYLNKRLKAFKEPEEKEPETKPAAPGWATT